jgi:hypothetical protein
VFLCRLDTAILAASCRHRREGEPRTAANGGFKQSTYQRIIWVHGCHCSCCLCCKLVQLARCYAAIDACSHLLRHKHLRM